MKPRKPIGFSVLACSLMGMLSSPSLAQPGPDGIDWVTVGAPGNAPYQGESDPLSPTFGRGGVDYEFKIGRTEVTTAQWVEFYNAALARSDPLPVPWMIRPLYWGAVTDTNYQGPGTRYVVNPNIADAGMLPAEGVSWRVGAMLCNWLTNGKDSSQASFMNGAYDANTFGGDGHGNFSDQATHNPGASYWIPTLDEYMKAAHYDPDANNGQGRWWTYPDMSDTPPIYGPPPEFGGDGSGQANAGFSLPNHAERLIPLESYPDVQSPWGVLDLAGGTMEWNEEVKLVDNGMRRGLDGSRRRYSGELTIDEISLWGSESPNNNIFFGVRLASAVPSPSGGLLIFAFASSIALRRPTRRRSHT